VIEIFFSAKWSFTRGVRILKDSGGYHSKDKFPKQKTKNSA